MRFLLQLILIAVLSYFLPMYLPWWIPVIVSFIVCFLIYTHGFISFIAGFLGTGMVWLGLSFKIDTDTQAILSEKLVQLFPFSDATYLIIGAGLVGGLIGGLGALTGNSLRSTFVKKKGRSMYA